MAADTIASGSVMITTDADKLHSGLKGAGNDVDKWGKSQGEKSGKGFGMSFGKMAKGALVVGIVAGVADLALDSFLELDEKAGHFEDMADNLGIGMENLMGLSHAADIAGVDIGTLEAGLQRMRLNVEGPLDEAMLNFARTLEGVEDPGKRAQMLFDMFGKSGVKMGTMFAQGADGIQKMVDEAKNLGLTISKEQAGQIGAAADAINNAKKSAKGLLTGFLTSFAPMFTALSSFATKFFSYLKPVIDWYMRAWGEIGEIVGFVWDAAIDGVKMLGSWIDSTFGGIMGWASEMPSVQDVIVRVFRNVGIAASYVWDTIKAGAGVISWVAGKIVQGFSYVVLAFEKIIGLAKLLPDELRLPWLDKLITGVGEFRAAVATKGEEMVAWGKGAWSGFGGTAKVFEGWLDRSLEKARAAKAEAKGALKDVLKVEAPDPLKFTGALLRNSTEAFSVVLKNQFRDLIPNEKKKELDELKGIRKAGVKAADKLGDIDKKLDFEAK